MPHVWIRYPPILPRAPPPPPPPRPTTPHPHHPTPHSPGPTQWLEAAGYQAPDVSKVDAQLTYTTGFFRMPPDWDDQVGGRGVLHL